VEQAKHQTARHSLDPQETSVLCDRQALEAKASGLLGFAKLTQQRGLPH
jgi:hypothetical protein